MRRLTAIWALAGAIALPATATARGHHRPPAPPAPVLVELFTAQGCEGCPQADLALGDLARRKGVIALTFSVDVWDYTGWTDTLATPEFTERQKSYVRRFKLRELSTPQVVVDGAAQADGLDKDTIDDLIDKAGAQARRRGPAPRVRVSADDDWVEVASARPPAAAADVWLVRYDPKRREIKVKLGDNKGKTVVVSNAVRELVRLGAWRGRARRFDLPEASSEGLKSVVVVQAAHGGPVLGLGRN